MLKTSRRLDDSNRSASRRSTRIVFVEPAMQFSLDSWRQFMFVPAYRVAFFVDDRSSQHRGSEAKLKVCNRRGLRWSVGLSLIVALLFIASVSAQEFSGSTLPGSVAVANSNTATSLPNGTTASDAGDASLRLSPAEATRDSDSSLVLPIPKPNEERSGTRTFQLPNGTAVNTGVALGVVLLLFLGVAWISKKAQPRSQSALPRDAVELLGRVSIDPKQYLQLIRIGRKLVLVNVSAQGVTTVTEVQEPAEVEHLLTLCRSGQSFSSETAFRESLRMEEQEPAGGGFIGASQRRTPASNRNRLWTHG